GTGTRPSSSRMGPSTAKSRRTWSRRFEQASSSRRPGPAPRPRRRPSSFSAHEPQLALRRRQPLDSVRGDDEVLLDADVAAAGHGGPVLDRENVADLDETERRRTVTIPARGKGGPAVVRGAPELMAERMHGLGVARADEARSRRGVDLPARDSQ